MSTSQQLRVWYIINPPRQPEYVHVSSPEEAIRVTNEIANAQLKMPWIHSNVFGLEIYDDSAGEWEEWYNDEGEDIRQYEDRLSSPAIDR